LRVLGAGFTTTPAGCDGGAQCRFFDNDRSWLTACGWFGPFGAYTKAQFLEMARLADHVRVRAGEVLIVEGQRSKEVFLIVFGVVGVTQGEQAVNTLGPGDFFGQPATLHCGPRNATVTAISDLEVFAIGPREFDAMLEIPGFRYALLTSMANRLDAVDAHRAGVHPLHRKQ
jgi:CRP-like cAMP-binding protein